MTSSAESLVAAGNPAAALDALQHQVRANASDPRLRVFLFQLLCVLGKWQRALDQLKVCGDLDAGTLAMVNTYGAALQCEAVREAVFDGRTLPHVFGPPTGWVASLAQALQLDAQGHPAQAAQLRAQALEQAPASRGTIDGQPFEWIADADSRLGPVLEVVVNGRYGWLPFAHLRGLSIEPVADLRDLVWIPAHLTFVNGADTVALIPVRYAATTAGIDPALLMSRKTEWLEIAEGQFRGLGQRLLATDAGDHALLDVRELAIAATDSGG
jgi:type VI secretion system protein ImpE